MNPLTDLDFWLNLGNLFAATAVALFAIKSGYIDKKYDDTKALEDELSSKYDLTHFIDDDIGQRAECDVISDTPYPQPPLFTLH